MANEQRRPSVGARIADFLTPWQSRAAWASMSDAGLSPLEKDLLVSYQVRQERPAYLGLDAFTAARVVSKTAISERLHAALTKAGMLLPPPAKGSEEDLDVIPVDTTKFDRHFVKEVPFLPAFALRRTVDLLFFWEEECMRLRSLDREERELLALRENATADMHAELDMRLDAVRLKKAMLPNERHHETSQSGRANQDQPPAYN